MSLQEASSENKMVRERIGLRAVRVLTNLLVLELLSGAACILTEVPRRGLAFCAFLMAALAFGSDQIQHRIKKLAPYTAACLLLSLSVTALSGLTDPALWKIFGAVCLIQVSCLYSARVRGIYVFVPMPGYLLFPAFVYIGGIITELSALKALAVGAEIILALLYLAWLNQKSLEHTYVAASERTRVPYRKIGLLNGGLLAAYLVLAGLICLVLTAIYSGDDLLMQLPLLALRLAGLVIYALLWIFSHIFPLGGDGAASADGGGPLQMPAGQELFPWMHTLWFILERVFGVVFLMILAYAFYRSLYDFYYDFRAADPETGDTRKRTETREKIRRTRRESLSPLDFSPRARIRREYRRYILSLPGKEKIEASHTPAQLEEAASGPGRDPGQDRKVIHDLYEKARYGKEKVTGEDLEEMRAAVRREKRK